MSALSDFIRKLLGSRPRVKNKAAAPPTALAAPPWITEALSMLGWHEDRDRAKLSAYLERHGKALGNPSVFPWCGDFVESVLEATLPNEALSGPLADNPFWARNWSDLGVETKPVNWCIAVFMRPGGGHVGFIVGQDKDAWHVLGGNQGDSVSVVRIPKNSARNSLIATRWPRSYPNPGVPIPVRRINEPLSYNQT